MKVLIFGATGMVGQGVLRECLLDPDVECVLTVVRAATERHHPKLRELVHRDFFDFTGIAEQLTGYDACFFCLGVSSAGMREKDYRRVTYDITLAAAEMLSKRNPTMTFIYVSGSGTDGTGSGLIMWARVKGQTENALLKLPFKAAVMFRPAFIQPLHGETSKTRLLTAFYSLMRPIFPIAEKLVPQFVTTTERVGRAMLEVAKRGASKPVLENRDIDRIARAAATH